MSDGLGNSYTWDPEERIASANGVAYTYSATGTRVGKGGSLPTDTIYFNGEPVARLSAGSWTDLIYGTAGILAEVPSSQPYTPHYRATDQLGSFVGMISSTGQWLGSLDYAPFGQLYSDQSSVSDPYEFTGKERDTESGNDYFDARYFSSTLGRFMSPDWSANADPVPYAKLENPQSLNLYSYVLNNPFSRTDPSGHAGAQNQDGGFHCSEDADMCAYLFAIYTQDPKRRLAQQQMGDPTLPTAEATPLLSNQDIAGLKNATEFALTVGVPDVGELGGGAKLLSSIGEDSKLVKYAEDAGKSVQKG